MRPTITCLALAVVLASAAYAITPDTDQYIPSVGHGLGLAVNGVSANWRADLWVFNPNTAAAQVDIFLLLRNQANPTPVSRHVAVNPGEVRFFPDIIMSEFGLDQTYGALRVVSDIPVAVTGSSYDANVTVESKQRGTGSAGQFFSGIPASAAIGRGELVDVPGLDQDGATTSGTWRSNLGLVETTGEQVNLDVQRLNADGTSVGSIQVTLRGREARQLDTLLWTIAATPGTGQRVRVTVSSGNGKVVASASRIDNRTGDPSTIEMVGQGRDGAYLCKADKTSYDTPVRLIVTGGAVVHVEATVLFTDEDAGAACTGGELLRIEQDLNPAPVLDAGAFDFRVDGTVSGVTVGMQLSGVISSAGRVTGTVTTTLSGAGGCSGTKTWPLVGARLP